MTLLTPKEAAAELKMSLKTLRGHVQPGSITYVINGLGKKRPRIAFAPQDIEAFEEAQRRRRIPAEVKPCRSIGRKDRGSTSMTSNGEVVAFSALRARKNASTTAAEKHGQVNAPAAPPKKKK